MYSAYTPYVGVTQGNPVTGGVGGNVDAGNYVIGSNGNYYSSGQGYSGPLFSSAWLQAFISQIGAFLHNNWLVLLVLAALLFGFGSVGKIL